MATTASIAASQRIRTERRADTLSGDNSNNTLYRRGNDNIVTYDDNPSAVNVHLSTGSAVDGYGDTDRIVGINNVFGSIYGDVLAGNGHANWLVGLYGDDSLVGGSSNDTADGGDGSDRLNGGNGNDELTGNDGDDVSMARPVTMS